MSAHQGRLRAARTLRLRALGVAAVTAVALGAACDRQTVYLVADVMLDAGSDASPSDASWPGLDAEWCVRAALRLEGAQGCSVPLAAEVSQLTGLELLLVAADGSSQAVPRVPDAASCGAQGGWYLRSESSLAAEAGVSTRGDAAVEGGALDGAAVLAPGIDLQLCDATCLALDATTKPYLEPVLRCESGAY